MVVMLDVGCCVVKQRNDIATAATACVNDSGSEPHLEDLKQENGNRPIGFSGAKLGRKRVGKMNKGAERRRQTKSLPDHSSLKPDRLNREARAFGRRMGWRRAHELKRLQLHE